MGVWMGGWPQSAFTSFWAFFEDGCQHHTKKWGWQSAFTIANLAIKVSIHTKNREDSQHTKKIEPPNSAYFQSSSKGSSNQKRKNKLRKLHRGLRLCPQTFWSLKKYLQPFTKTIKMFLSFNFHFEKGFAPPLPTLNNAWKDILSTVGRAVIDKS